MRALEFTVRGRFGRPRLAACVLLLVICGLSGQTPAPSPAAGKPLRQLEYHFADSFGGQTENHFNGLGNGIETSSGVGTSSVSDGGQGTMQVDILSVTPDGALNIRIAEWVQREPRPRQAYTCTVYGNTTVMCPTVAAPSDAEWVLLSYLGRQFVDAAPWDANHHWQRKDDAPEFTTVEDFTMVNSDNPKSIVIREKKTMKIHNGSYESRMEDVNITYDRTMEVPSAIHDDMTMSGDSSSGHSVFDFQLTKDSFAGQAH